MDLSKMQQEHAIYMTAVRKESERVIASIRVKCNASIHQHYLQLIQNAFNQVMNDIVKYRNTFEMSCIETRKDYNSADELEFLQEEIRSHKMMAIALLNSNSHESNIKIL
jgi:hypothetical protein